MNTKTIIAVLLVTLGIVFVLIGFGFRLELVLINKEDNRTGLYCPVMYNNPTSSSHPPSRVTR